MRSVGRVLPLAVVVLMAMSGCTSQPSTPTHQPPSVSFSVDVESGTAPLTVTFKNTSDGQTTSRIVWDLGDGTISTEQNPVHVYTVAGSYTIMLTVPGPYGKDTVTKRDLITVQPGPTTSLEINPSSVTLGVQKATQFTAVAKDKFGNVVPGTVAWGIAGEGGSITHGGLFTADTMLGTFAHTVTASMGVASGELVATASVIVGPGPVASVVVRPAQVTLGIGITQTFSFEVFDESGNEISHAPGSWSVSPDTGQINQDGYFTAGTNAGSYAGAVQFSVVDGAYEASATADVSILPDPLATIDVQPSDIIVDRDTEQQFTAIGLDQHGNEISDLAFLWEATGGSIDQTGVITAVGQSGSFEVKASATYNGETRIGSAAFVIPLEYFEFPPVIWDFTTGLQGWETQIAGVWEGEVDVRDLRSTADGLVFESIGSDPMIFSPLVDYPHDENLRVTIRMRTDASPPGKFYIGREGEWFSSEDNARCFDVNPDGHWHEYEVVLPSWGRTRKVLRLDPATSTGHVEIAWIKVETD
jgi:PKD repeat protein